MTFKLSQKSLDKLDGVHEDLISVVKLAITITKVDFGVLEGLRTVARQKKLVAEGKSQTMNSRHLSGLAVDLGAFVNGKYINGDTKEESLLYDHIADAMLEAASKLGIPVIWGGSWKSIIDKPHFELNKNFYKEKKND